MVEKGETNGYKHFLFLPECSQKAFFLKDILNCNCRITVKSKNGSQTVVI